MPDRPFTQKPLSGRTVLVTCSAKKMAELVFGIEALGGTALPFQAMDTCEIEDKTALDKALASLPQYSWIIFTSANGVGFFLQRMNELGIAMDRKMPKICAIGPATAEAIRESGFSVDLIPEYYVAEGVVEALGKFHGGLQALAGHRILIPRAEEARELLPETLLEAGAFVDIAPCYRTVRGKPDDAILRQLRDRHPDLIIFMSSSGIRNLIDILGENEGRNILMQSTLAVIGPITCATAESFGKRAEIVPSENTIASLIEAIRAYYASGPNQPVAIGDRPSSF